MASGTPFIGKATQVEATEQEWISVGGMGKGSAQKASGAGWSSEHPSRRLMAGGAAGAGPQTRFLQVGRGEGGGKGAELQKAPQGAGKATPRSTAWVAPSWMSLYPGAPGHNRTKPRGLALRRLCDLEAESLSPSLCGDSVYSLARTKAGRVKGNLEGAGAVGGKRGG